MTSIKAMCERFSDRQFKEGCDIFAVQWNNIHATAQAGDIRGLRWRAVLAWPSCYRRGVYRGTPVTRSIPECSDNPQLANERLTTLSHCHLHVMECM